MMVFLMYSKVTQGGGAVVKSTSSGGGSTATSSSGGGTTATSSSGGGVAKSTASGGGTTQSSSSGGGSTQSTNQYGSGEHVEGTVGNQLDIGGGNHVHRIPVQLLDHTHRVTVPNHSHSVSIPSHTHSFDVPNHTHSVTVPNHTHSVNIPNHTHDIDIPAHSHEIEHGIFKLNRKPTRVTIKVDGNTVPHTALTGDSIDLIPYLSRDSEERVNRGWHTVEITPNDLGRISAQVMTQFFMQSRGGVDA